MRALRHRRDGFVGGPPAPAALRARGARRCAAWSARRAAATQLDGLGVEFRVGDLDDRRVAARRRSTAATSCSTAPPTTGSPRRRRRERSIAATSPARENLFARRRRRRRRAGGLHQLGRRRWACAPTASAADETAPSTLRPMIGPYKRSKFLAERVADASGDAQAAGRDRQPVDAGRRGRRQARRPRGSFSSISWRAACRPTSTPGSTSSTCATSPRATCWPPSAGVVGERYILGHRNLTLPSSWTAGAASPACRWARLRLPHWRAAARWRALEAPIARLRRRRAARARWRRCASSRKKMFFDAGQGGARAGPAAEPDRDRARARGRLVSRPRVRAAAAGEAGGMSRQPPATPPAIPAAGGPPSAPTR